MADSCSNVPAHQRQGHLSFPSDPASFPVLGISGQSVSVKAAATSGEPGGDTIHTGKPRMPSAAPPTETLEGGDLAIEFTATELQPVVPFQN